MNIKQRVQQTKEILNYKYNNDTKVKLIEKFAEQIRKNEADCDDYVTSAGKNIDYHLSGPNQMTKYLGTPNLYEFIEATLEIMSYNSDRFPFSCRSLFDNTIIKPLTSILESAEDVLSKINHSETLDNSMEPAGLNLDSITASEL